MENNMKAVVVGAGVISEWHIGPYREKGVEVVAIVEPVQRARDAAMARFGIPHGFDTVEQALDLQPDIASLCTPNYLHMPHAVALLEAGVHVIVEKPMACTVAECDRMIAAAGKSGKMLFVAHSQRFVPAHQLMIQTARSGALGRPVMAITTFIGNEYGRMNAPENWKGDYEHSGGGVLIDNGSHIINLLLGILGPVKYVEASGERILIEYEHKAEDTAVVNLKFACGALATLSCTFVAQASAYPKGYGGAGIRTEIIGENGALYAGNGDPAFVFVDNSGANRIEYANAADIPASLPANPILHFIDCLRDGTEPFVTMHDGRDTIAVVEAAYKSAREGRRVYL